MNIKHKEKYLFALKKPPSASCQTIVFVYMFSLLYLRTAKLHCLQTFHGLVSCKIIIIIVQKTEYEFGANQTGNFQQPNKNACCCHFSSNFIFFFFSAMAKQL